MKRNVSSINKHNKKERKKKMFYQKQIEEIEKELATSAQGLSKEEVSRRQKNMV